IKTPPREGYCFSFLLGLLGFKKSMSCFFAGFYLAQRRKHAKFSLLGVCFSLELNFSSGNPCPSPDKSGNPCSAQKIGTDSRK
ncbi:hypothetical protein, partial [Flavobacterium sp. JAS]|uniref:hypothetical protein n=1 Tax=Flavobacterium sp. JAS TaxID=2897329 RepID=UPI001E643BEE